MKDLVSYSLDINIPMQSDVPEKRLLDLTVSAVDYYRLIQPSTLIKSIFLWLDGLGLIVGLLTDPNCTKSESYNDNCDMGREANEMSWIKEMPPTDPDHIESESHADICSKNNCNISDGVDVQELLSDNPKGSIHNYDIGKVGYEVTWIEEMPATNCNYIESENHGDNYNNNNDGNRMDDKEQESDDLEGPK